MAQIVLNFEEIRTYANEIKALSGQITELFGEITTQINSINGVWDGLAHEAFLEQYQTMSAQLKNLPEIIEGLSSMATAYADTMEELEKSMATKA